jgi:hypothetical protein
MLSPKNASRIKKLFPPPAEIWKRLVDSSMNPATEANAHVYLCGVCLRDLADTMQTAYKCLFQSLKDYFCYHQSRNRGDYNTAEAIHILRFQMDLGIIALLSSANHFSAALWHLYSIEKKPLGKRYKSAHSLLDALNPEDKKHLKIDHLLAPIVKYSGYDYLKDYRDSWVHRGLPVIKGEHRFSRRKLWEEEEFYSGRIGLYQSSSGQLNYVEYRENTKYHARHLIKRASGLYAQIRIQSGAFLSANGR